MDPRLRVYKDSLNKLKIFLEMRDNKNTIEANMDFLIEETKNMFSILMSKLGAGGRNSAAKDVEIVRLNRLIKQQNEIIAQLKEELNNLRSSNNNYSGVSNGTLIAPNSQNMIHWVEPEEKKEPSSPSSGKYTRNELERILGIRESERPLLTEEQYNQVMKMETKLMSGPRGIVPKKRGRPMNAEEMRGRARKTRKMRKR